MMLDANSFELILTPEVALGMIQKEVKRKGWNKYEVEEIRLVYVPYYTFSFDVNVEGSKPISGKAALNANSGDIDEFVPMVLDKPFKKTRKSQENAEVEDTTIPSNEVKAVATSKIAAQTGIKKEAVTISAISKVYLPFFRIWLNLNNNVYKIEVDGLLGAPLGLEAITDRPKSWEEAASDTIKKMRSPAGLAQLAGETVALAAGAGKSKEVAQAEGMLGNKQVRWAILILIIVVVALLVFAPKKGKVTCESEEGILDFVDQCRVEGFCSFSNPSEDPQSIQASIVIHDNELKQDRLEYGQIVGVILDGKAEGVKDFSVEWPSGGAGCDKFSWRYEEF